MFRSHDIDALNTQDIIFVFISETKSHSCLSLKIQPKSCLVEEDMQSVTSHSLMLCDIRKQLVSHHDSIVIKGKNS